MKLLKKKKAEGETPAVQTAPKKKKRAWLGWLAVILVVALAAVGGVFFFRRGNPFRMGSFDAAVEEKLMAETAERGSIDSLLATAGSISDAEGTQITFPEGIELTSILVRNGSLVQTGDVLAYADKSSVMTKITEVQALLEELDGELEEAQEDEIESTLKAAAAGRVKVIYAEAGDDVQSVMLEHGALALVSLDGQMAVEIETQAALSVGDSVTVKTSDSTEYSGRVSEKRPDTAIITVSDESTAYGDTVTCYDENGKELGSSALYIHSEQKISGFSGTVEQVKISADQKISENTVLFTLESTAYSADFDILLNQRHELEEKLHQLFVLYQNGTICAEVSGMVSGLDESLLTEEKTETEAAEESAAGQSYWSSNVAFLSSASRASLWEVSDARFLGSAQGSTERLLADEGEASGDIGGEASGNMTGDIGGSDITGGDNTGGIGGNNFSGGFDISSFSGGSFSMGGSQGGTAVAQEAQTTDTTSKYTLTETTLCSVIPQETVIITVTVDELDILSLSLGDEAQITLDALVGQSFTGTVTKIADEGTNSGGNTKFEVEVTMDRTASMYVGMNAAVNFVQETHENVVLIPAAALQEIGNKTFVYTTYDEKNDTLLNPVEVETGATDGEMVEITSGLDVGDAYYYRYADSIIWSFQQ